MSYPRALDPAASVSVLPTTTTLATFDVSATATLTVQVNNLDGSQQLDCAIWRHATTSDPFVMTTLGGLQGIGPGSSACIDIDCGGNVEVRITGAASGAGLTATISARDKPRSRA